MKPKYIELLARYKAYEWEKTPYPRFFQRVVYSGMKKEEAIKKRSYAKPIRERKEEKRIVNKYEQWEQWLDLYRTGAWSA